MYSDHAPCSVCGSEVRLRPHPGASATPSAQDGPAGPVDGGRNVQRLASALTMERSTSSPTMPVIRPSIAMRLASTAGSHATSPSLTT